MNQSQETHVRFPGPCDKSGRFQQEEEEEEEEEESQRTRRRQMQFVLHVACVPSTSPFYSRNPLRLLPPVSEKAEVIESLQKFFFFFLNYYYYFLGRCVSVSMAGGSVSECKEYLFKVLVIGELGVGKTSIIKRYVHQLFSQHYRATIGVDFALKVINWDSKTLVRLQLWDIAGQERFGNMTRVYYKEAVGAFVVFDVTRVSTFEAVSKWKHDLDSKVKLANGSPIPSVLLANKCDQKKDNSNNTTLMDNFCKETGFLGWFETSAKDNINVDEAARFLVENILANDKGLLYEESNGDRVKLEQETVVAESKSGCC
uniref:Ras-related protein Rab n=3 Tax=Pleuronectoidei TaxID=30942 RepID=A0A3P8URI9_CYNSE